MSDIFKVRDAAAAKLFSLELAYTICEGVLPSERPFVEGLFLTRSGYATFILETLKKHGVVDRLDVKTIVFDENKYNPPFNREKEGSNLACVAKFDLTLNEITSIVDYWLFEDEISVGEVDVGPSTIFNHMNATADRMAEALNKNNYVNDVKYIPIVGIDTFPVII